MEAVKKLPPAKRFQKPAKSPKTPTKKIEKLVNKKSETKSTMKSSTKSPAVKSQESSIKKKPSRKLDHETTFPEHSPLVAPRQSPSYKSSESDLLNIGALRL